MLQWARRDEGIWLSQDGQELQGFSALASSSSASVTVTAACFFTWISSQALRTFRKAFSLRSIAPSASTPEAFTATDAKWIVWPAPENEIVVRRDDWNEYLVKVEGNHYISPFERRGNDRLHRSEAEAFRWTDCVTTIQGGQAATCFSKRFTSAT